MVNIKISRMIKSDIFNLSIIGSKTWVWSLRAGTIYSRSQMRSGDITGTVLCQIEHKNKINQLSESESTRRYLFFQFYFWSTGSVILIQSRVVEKYMARIEFE